MVAAQLLWVIVQGHGNGLENDHYTVMGDCPRTPE